jgi:acyl-CoA thioester hydrolase
MNNFSEIIQVRWADIDANRHLRHSVYYDYGAMTRMNFLSAHGLTTKKMEELMLGPVLFREEAIFKREILFEDKITVTIELLKTTPDYGRWSIRHLFLKEDNALAAIINIDGAWIDLMKRKLAVPNELIQHIFEKFPRASDFQMQESQKKD